MRKYPVKDKDYKFRLFKRASGLTGPGEAFPALRALTEQELNPDVKLYLNEPHEATYNEIRERARSPLVAVLVTPGHGCTTLARYVYKMSRADAVATGLLPVQLALSDIDPKQPANSLEELIRHQSVNLLVNQPWEHVMQDRSYGDLLGVTGTFADVERKRQELRGLVALGQKVNWREVRRVAPRLVPERFVTLLAQLARDHGIRATLQTDLSSREQHDPTSTAEEAYVEKIENLKRAVKGLHERDATAANPTLPSVLYEMYFVSAAGLQLLLNGWRREYSIVDYPHYGRMDFFSILSFHYPQRLEPGQRKQEALVSILEPDALDYEFERFPLERLAEMLERDLIETTADPGWDSFKISRLKRPKA